MTKVTTYSGIVTNVSKQIATISLKRHDDKLSDVKVPAQYRIDTGILGYEMGDTVNVTLSDQRVMTTHKYNSQIFYVVFERNGEELVIVDQNLVDREKFEINEANL